MIGIFRQKNPGNSLILFIYALVLKFPSFLRPLPALKQEEDHYLYNWLLNFLAPLHIPNVGFSVLSFVLILIQASLLNRICNVLKMFPKSSFLPAMAYILLSSLLPEWNQFSAPLLINTFLIWMFYRMSMLYNTNNPNISVFNIGLIIGLMTLVNEPAILFVLLIPFALFIMRPFRIREWLIGFLGVTTPYYFLAITLYLTDKFELNRVLPSINLDFPAIPSSIAATIAIAMLVIPFMQGGYYVQENLNKMLIQGRKTWSLLLIFLIVSLLIILVNGGNHYVNWICCLIPLAVFHAAAYFYPTRSLFASLMHWVIFLFALTVNYFPQVIP
ncbi:MAG TPA: DUF6427 family protein [Flavitalea sp.]|nr:DUF6427 family protein [Flavitalea sp.]